MMPLDSTVFDDFLRRLRRSPIFRLGLGLIVLAASVGHAATSKQISHLRQPYDLRCNGKKEPLAVEDAHPAFSWQLMAWSDALHGVGQSSYRIQVFATERHPELSDRAVWDSGVIQS